MKTNYKCIPFDIELCKKIINKKIKVNYEVSSNEEINI